MKDIAEEFSGKDLLFCFSHLRWNFVYQRPQHLLGRAARRYRVYFIEEPVFAPGVQPSLKLEKTPEGVEIAVPVLPTGLDEDAIEEAQRALVDALWADVDRGGRTIIWYYTPIALPFSRHIPADVRIYDNMDELSAFLGAPPRMLALERELFERADLVFTGGHSLFEAKRHRHRSVHAFPSSIDAAHFRTARQQRAHGLADQDHIPRPRLGFFGVIDERMDIELVGRVAALRPDWQLVMIGPVVKIDPATLPRHSNLHWLGPKSYRELPDYLAGWDLGIMPFAINPATQFISPTKTPEFLAAGLPVISTRITDVVRPYAEMGLVEIADTAEAFVAKAEQLLAAAKDGWLSAVDRHLSTMSWDLTWGGMHDLIEQAMPSRQPTSKPHTNPQEAIHV
jgi:glycosyltransferase involved in cell wall biosynthesis